MSIFSKLFGSNSVEEKKNFFDEKLGRLAILGKNKNWNSEKSCKICEKLIGSNTDAWDIEWVALSDVNKKDIELFSVCEECYEKRYGIYPEEERKIPTSEDFSEYVKLSFIERNKQIYNLFPKDFWKKIQITKNQGMFLVNFLLDGKSDIYSMSSVEVAKVLNTDSLKIIDKMDEYTKKVANSYSSDEFRISKTTKNGEHVLFYDRTIPDKQAIISHWELLGAGLHMIKALPQEQQKELCEKFHTQNFIDDDFLRALEVSFATLFIDFLEREGVYKKYSTPTFPSQVVKQIGFIKFVHWLRKFGVIYDFADSRKEFFYKTLLSMSKSK